MTLRPDATAARFDAETMQRLFDPPAVTLVGATPRSHVTEVLLRQVVRPDRPFPGKVNVVSPTRSEVLGHKTYPSMKDVDGDLGLVYVLVSTERCIGVLEEMRDQGLAERISGIAVYAAGFAEVGEVEAQEALADVAFEMGVPLLGPQATGLISAQAGLVGVTFPLPEQFVPGRVGFVAQSTGLLGSAASWLLRHGVGVGVGVGVGNAAALDYTDLTAALLRRDDLDVVCTYVDAVADPRGIETIGAVAQETGKPVVLFKGAQGAAAQRAARSHTGVLATAERVVRGVADQCGVVVADSFEELLWAAELFVRPDVRALTGVSVGVVTQSGGGGIIATECIESAGVPMPDPTEEGLATLGLTDSQTANPFDTGAIALDAFEEFAKSVQTFVSDPAFDLIVKAGSLGVPTEAIPAHRRMAETVVTTALAAGKLPIMAFPFVEDPRDFREVVTTPGVLVTSGDAELSAKLRLMQQWTTGVIRGLAGSSAAVAHRDAPSAPATSGHEDGGVMADDELGRELVRSVGATVPAMVVVEDTADVAASLAALGWPDAPVVAKTGRVMPHRAKAGGVIVGLRELEEIQAAVALLKARFQAPVVLMEQVSYESAYFVGLQRGTHGRELIAFGSGVATDDSEVEIRLCPLDERTAGRLVDYARRKLGREPAPGLGDFLLRLSRAFCERPELAVVDANPVVERPDGRLAAVDVKAYLA